MADAQPFTTLLVAWRGGDKQAGQKLVTAAYQQLRRLAAHHLQQEREGHTLEPTALVHELYMKLFGGAPIAWQDRAHFFAIAAQQMRRVLVDHARARVADKRGGAAMRLSLSQVEDWAGARDATLVALDEALRRLEQMDNRAARVVELRFFAGLQEDEAAAALGISLATLKRDWKFARTWLASQLMSPRPGS